MKKKSVIYWLAILTIGIVSFSSCVTTSKNGCPKTQGMSGY
ncbi:MAG TPA: hypothetical protein VKT28_07745 [Puia sp.]|nr:hypothetical protein [Puia sp.]